MTTYGSSVGNIFQGSSNIIRKPVIANPGQTLSNGAYTSGGSGDLGGTSRVNFTTTGPCGSFQLVYLNYYPFPDNNAPTNAGSITVQASFEYYNGTIFFPITFNGGQSSVTIPLYGIAVTDPFEYADSAGNTGRSNIFIRTFVQVAANGKFPTGLIANTYGNGLLSDGNNCGHNYVQGQTAGNGANALTTSGYTWMTSTNQVYCYGPSSVIGTPAAGLNQPTVCVVGDSIATGLYDTCVNMGYISQALTNNLIGYHKVSVPGDYLFANSGFMAEPQRRFVRMQLIDASTHVIWEYGTNDISQAGATYANMKSFSLSGWGLCASRGVKVMPCTLTPRIANISGNTYYPVSVQTVPSYDPIRQQYNAWLRAPASAGAGNSATYDAAQLGITLLPIFDGASYVETDASNSTPGGPSNPNLGSRWWCGTGNNTNYTYDGTHPNPAGHAVMQQAFVTSAITVSSIGPGGGSGSSTPPNHFP